MHRPTLTTTACLILLLTATASAQTYKPGDKVVVVDQVNLVVSGSEVVDEVFPGLVLRVGAVKDKWLWLSNGKPGWLDQKHVVPLSRDAISALTTALRGKHSEAYLHNALGFVWMELGEPDIAVDEWTEVIRLVPHHFAGWGNRALAHHESGDYERAIGDHSEAIRIMLLDSNEQHSAALAKAYSNRAIALGANEEYLRAIEDCNKAIRIDPEFQFTYHARGYAHHHLGQYDQAIADYGESIRRDAKFVKSYSNRAEIRATCPNAAFRDGELAIADATKACELSNWSDPAHIATLAAAYAESGDFDAAIRWQTKAIELAADDDKQDYRTRLARYESGQPYRDEPKSAALTQAD